MRKHHLVTIISIALILSLSGLLYAAEPEDQIKYRKNIMGIMGGHTGAVFAIAGGKVDHADAFLSHAAGLSAAAQMVKTIFPEDSAMGDTRAKQDIWDKPAEFKDAVNKLEVAASTLLKAAEDKDQEAIGAALKQLGGACKNCHDNFRQKQE